MYWLYEVPLQVSARGRSYLGEALEDGAFAGAVLPVLQEFMGSRGQSERAACLVAVTRIRKISPQIHADERR